MGFKTDEEFAAQELANQKKADADFERRNKEALADRRRILEQMGLPDDTQPQGTAQKKETVVAKQTGAIQTTATQTGTGQTAEDKTGKEAA
jgi:hypothetical protein